MKAIVSPIDNAPFHIGVENFNYKFLFVREFASTSVIYLLSGKVVPGPYDGVQKFTFNL